MNWELRRIVHLSLNTMAAVSIGLKVFVLCSDLETEDYCSYRIQRIVIWVGFLFDTTCSVLYECMHLPGARRLQSTPARRPFDCEHSHAN